MDRFDYLQSHKDFSRLTRVPPVRKANENRSRRGPCLSFPREEPTLVAATAPSCGDGQEEDEGQGRLCWPQRAGKRGRSSPALAGCWAKELPASRAGLRLSSGWDLLGAEGFRFWRPVGVALGLGFPCYSFCLSLDLLFSGKQAPRLPIRSLSP